MSQFPKATTVGRIMPKDAFYKRMNLSAELKEKFVTDIKRITVSNSLTANTLNLEKDSEVIEILILTVDLKIQDFDGRIIESIARQNPHQIVFLLRFEDTAKLSVYYNKLYTTEWKPAGELQLTVKGFNLDDVWYSFLEQIALKVDIVAQNVTDAIAVKLQKQDAFIKLQKEIDKLERLARSEKQPLKKFELFQQLQDKKREIKLMQ